jgi:bacteriocin biosynthesis cyclodehydratase domain-containing protein
MLPKLKGDTFFIPTPDGIYFRSNRGSLKLKGKVIHRWIESLAPYLNGEHTLAQITTGLDAEKQAMVTDLVNTLLKQGFLKDLSQDQPHHLSQTERETYAAEIAFVDSFCDSAAARFERFREQQVLLIGSGLTLMGLVKASLKSGLRQVAVMTTPECETNTRRHQEYLDLFHKGDPTQTLREVEVPVWENEAEVLSTLQPFDTIMHVTDRPMLARASMLNRLCVEHKKTLIQAVIVDDHAWIGPLVLPPTNTVGTGGRAFVPTAPVRPLSGCWECAMLRLQGNLTNREEQLPLYAFQDQESRPVSRFVALPTAALVANLLNFEVFKSVTEAGPMETAGNLVEVDLETLRTQKHAFMPHPLCRSCQHPAGRDAAQFQDTIRQLEQGVEVVAHTSGASTQAGQGPALSLRVEDEDLFSKQVTACFETRLGLFSSLDEGDLVQLPLSVCKAVVSNPMPSQSVGAAACPCPPAVLGFGLSFGTARKRAAERACEVYAASVVDRRQLPFVYESGSGQGPALSLRVGDAERIAGERFLSVGSAQGTVPTDEVKEWTWATDLLTKRACLVPAALVYPVLCDLSPLGNAGLGISSGTSWAEAVVRGLLKVCRYLTVTQIERAQRPYPPMDLSAIPNPPRLLHILEQMGGSVMVYDVTGSLAPTLAICSGDQTLAYSTHVDTFQALQDGLEQAVIYKQLSGEQVLIDNLPFVPALPQSLRGFTTAEIEAQTGSQIGESPMHTGFPDTYEVTQEWPDLADWLQDLLQMDGWRAFAVPLDHDPVLHQIRPYIVHVVVARA